MSNKRKLLIDTDGVSDDAVALIMALQSPAVDRLVEIINANPGTMLVTLGPLTNIALAVSKSPEIIAKVSRCVVMGGAACAVGNITPAAEFNIWCDPEAARIVFRSGLPVEMVGWELCRDEANLLSEDIRYCQETINTPLAHFAIECNSLILEPIEISQATPRLACPTRSP